MPLAYHAAVSYKLGMSVDMIVFSTKISTARALVSSNQTSNNLLIIKNNMTW